MEILLEYGSLKEGFYNHQLLARAEFLGQGKTRDFYSMYVAYFPDVVNVFSMPYVVRSPPNSQISGKLYSVDLQTLIDIDFLNTQPQLHYREEVQVIQGHAPFSSLTAWIYFFPQPVGVLEPSGSYHNLL